MLLVGHIYEKICVRFSVCLQATMQDHVTWGPWAYVSSPPDRGARGCFHRLCCGVMTESFQNTERRIAFAENWKTCPNIYARVLALIYCSGQSSSNKHLPQRRQFQGIISCQKRGNISPIPLAARTLMSRAGPMCTKMRRFKRQTSNSFLWTMFVTGSEYKTSPRTYSQIRYCETPAVPTSVDKHYFSVNKTAKCD